MWSAPAPTARYGQRLGAARSHARRTRGRGSWGALLGVVSLSVRCVSSAPRTHREVTGPPQDGSRARRGCPGDRGARVCASRKEERRQGCWRQRTRLQLPGCNRAPGGRGCGEGKENPSAACSPHARDRRGACGTRPQGRTGCPCHELSCAGETGTVHAHTFASVRPGLPGAASLRRQCAGSSARAREVATSRGSFRGEW